MYNQEKNQGVITMQDRKTQIVNILSQIGYATVSEIAAQVYASEPTIRRDFASLERNGIIRRTHGGATYLENQNFFPFDLRNKVNMQEKIKIGQLAARLLHNGDCIFIDIGSTAYCFAKSIDPKMQLTVMTTGLPIANLLARYSNITVECPGGAYDFKYSTFYGEETIKAIQQRNAKYFFVSTGMFSAQSGATGSAKLDIAAKHAFNKQAKETVLLMDHTKEKEDGYYTIFNWNEIDILVTDRQPSKQIIECCEKNNIRQIWPGNE